MTKKQYIEKLFERIDNILLEEARVRSKLRSAILELRKTLTFPDQKSNN